MAAFDKMLHKLLENNGIILFLSFQTHFEEKWNRLSSRGKQGKYVLWNNFLEPNFMKKNGKLRKTVKEAVNRSKQFNDNN